MTPTTYAVNLTVDVAWCVFLQVPLADALPSIVQTFLAHTVHSLSKRCWHSRFWDHCPFPRSKLRQHRSNKHTALSTPTIFCLDLAGSASAAGVCPRLRELSSEGGLPRRTSSRLRWFRRQVTLLSCSQIEETDLS